MLTLAIVFLCVTFASSYWLTGAVTRYALHNCMLDRPNGRSSHSTPTPRGGGAAFAGVIIGIVLPVLFAVYPDERELWIALASGGALVAVLGWLDDRGGLSARVRILVHTIAACWAVYCIGGWESLYVGGASLPLGMIGSAIAVLVIVWFTNLFNFMDGIDGLCATEVIVVGAFAGLLFWMTGQNALAAFLGLMVAAVIGFLPWNWSPAQVFMGDCGSGTLGFLVGTLMVASETIEGLPALTWCLLLGVFLMDATATLLYRVFAGQKWYQAHRSHAYQKAVQAGYSHARVTSLVVLFNLLLGAAAVFTVLVSSSLLFLLLAAIVLLFWLWNHVRRLEPAKLESAVSAKQDPSTPRLFERAA